MAPFLGEIIPSASGLWRLFSWSKVPWTHDFETVSSNAISRWDRPHAPSSATFSEMPSREGSESLMISCTSPDAWVVKSGRPAVLEDVPGSGPVGSVFGSHCARQDQRYSRSRSEGDSPKSRGSLGTADGQRPKRILLIVGGICKRSLQTSPGLSVPFLLFL
jgi:hypothetical protein